MKRHFVLHGLLAISLSCVVRVATSAPATHLSIVNCVFTFPPCNVFPAVAGVPYEFQVLALDDSEQPATNYIYTVTITSSVPAILPPAHKFTVSDEGSFIFKIVSLQTGPPGQLSLFPVTATDDGGLTTSTNFEIFFPAAQAPIGAPALSGFSQLILVLAVSLLGLGTFMYRRAAK
jgi:hypothetical protein